MTEGMKTCGRCKKELSLTKFPSHDGRFRSYCKVCGREYAREYMRKKRAEARLIQENQEMCVVLDLLKKQKALELIDSISALAQDDVYSKPSTVKPLKKK